jgi:hypothetical protein
VQNSAPTAPAVSMSSAVTPPMEGTDDLTCSIIATSSDIDNDSLSYTFEWYDPNGSLQQTVANTTNTLDIYPGTSTFAGIWSCVVTASDGQLSNNATDDITVDADWPGNLDLTNCGKTGATGPSQSDCDSEYNGTTLDGMVTVSSGIQYFTLPSNGTYRISVYGAQGGNLDGTGAYGAYMRGDFILTQGDTLKIIVGQMGLDSQDYGGNDDGGGGGGGTFVALSDNTPLIIAGGGGGTTGSHSSTTSPGQTGTSGGFTYSNGAGMGTNGDGGADGQTNGRASGGGGFYTDGQSSQEGGSGDLGGYSFLNGGNGGTSGNNGGYYGGDGGFGGGGSGWHNSLCRSGGAGGYSGGQGGTWSGQKSGGGGGSYNTGSNPDQSSGQNSGHGYVIIEKL